MKIVGFSATSLICPNFVDTNAKGRDVYRQRYLESKGWTIERIWSRNWWRNPSAEVERIDQKVKELLRSEEVREKVVISLCLIECQVTSEIWMFLALFMFRKH